MIGDLWNWLIGSGPGPVLALPAAVIAIITFWRTMRDSRDRTRPYVVVEYRRPEYTDSVLELVVRNAGLSAARDLKVQFDPMPDGDPHKQPLRAFVKRRYARTIAALQPGQELTNTTHLDAGDEGESDLPHHFTASVSYRGSGRRRWSETFDLDATLWADETTARSDRHPEQRLKQIRDSLKALTKAMTGTLTVQSVAERDQRKAAARKAHEDLVRRVSQRRVPSSGGGSATAAVATTTAEPDPERPGSEPG